MERAPQGWSRELKNGVYVLTRTFQFDDFTRAMAFASRVGEAADAADQHVDGGVLRCQGRRGSSRQWSDDGARSVEVGVGVEQHHVAHDGVRRQLQKAVATLEHAVSREAPQGVPVLAPTLAGLL